jgi:hypothetical protein
MSLKEKDYFPNKLKTEIPREVFEILSIEEDKFDFSEDTNSGGGSTVTKQAWGKILKRLLELKEKRIL